MTAAVVAQGPSPLRAAGWALLFLGVGFALTLVFVVAVAFVSGVPLEGGADPRSLLVQGVGGLLGYGVATWAIGLRWLGLTATDLRWAPLGRATPGFGLGLLLGALPAGLALGLSILVAGARFIPDAGDLAAYGTQVSLTILLLLPAALLEEVMFRGVAQVTLARGIGRVPAILVLSVTFAVAHVFNPNWTALGLVNIALAGVLLGLAFYLPGGIWAAWGAHLGWNATLAAMDAPVSGLPFAIPLIDYVPGGPQWLTGGTFGPEGGLLATLMILGASVTAWRWRERQST